MEMKRFVLALLIAGFTAGGSTTVSGQKALPPCDSDNGGITLPPGFCALVVHEGVGEARHIVVTENSDIYVITRRGPNPPAGQERQPGGIYGLRDTNGDGKADMVTEKFGDIGGTGLELRNGYLYFASTTSIGRFRLTPGQLKPAGPAEVIVDGLPA